MASFGRRNDRRFWRTVTFTVPLDSVVAHRVIASVTDNYSIGGKDTLSIETRQVPVAGLVAYYPFNGNVNDESGNGNNGTIYGATPISDRFGSANRAFSFDGIDDHIDAPHRSSLQPPNQLSVCAWVKIRSFYAGSNGISMIVKKGAPWGGVGQYLIYYTNRSFTFWVTYANGADIALSTPDTSIQLNKWYFLVLTYNKQSQNGYVNGILRVTSKVSQQLGSNSDNLSIGWNSGNSSFPYPVSGTIDDIRIYDRALSESEIQAVYHEGGWTGD